MKNRDAETQDKEV